MNRRVAAGPRPRRFATNPMAVVVVTLPPVVAVLVAVFLAVLGAAGPADAGGGHRDTPTSGIEVTTPSPATIGVSVYSGGRRSGSPGCSWRLVPVDTVRGRVPADPEFIAAHRLFDRHGCDDPRHDTYVWVPITDVRSTLVPALVDYMTARLPRPEPILAPVRPEGWVVAQLPLDFRTTTDSWRAVVASAAIDGPEPLYVTATARPVRLEFLPGDPARSSDVVSCTGRQPIAPYDPVRPGACSYRYRNASSTAPNRRTFDARLRIHWAVGYRSSDGPGAVAVEPTETLQPVAVAEIKALVACIGPRC